MRSTRRFGALAALGALVVAACSSGSQKSQGPADGGAGGSEGGHEPAPCTSLGSVTLLMHAPAGYAAASSLSIPGDGRWWYSVGKADGTGLQIFQQSLAVCQGCVQSADAIGQSCDDADGTTASWNGTAVAGSSSCTYEGQSSPCDNFECLPAGSYVATMCAYTSEDACGDFGTPTCVKVPFEYPTTQPVVGTILPLDGGPSDAAAGDGGAGDARSEDALPE